MRRHTVTALLLLAGLGLVFTFAALHFGFPDIADDAVAHALWYSSFSHQLAAGDWYPRWLMDLNGGLGSPAFFYYPPIPYLLTSVLHPLYSGDPNGWAQLGGSVAIALIASGWCAYLWLRNVAGHKAGLVGAALYMILPYHLAVDLFQRGAFAEFWAFVWMPLVLHFIDRSAAGHRRATAGLAASYGLLIMTHLPTTVVFSPVAIVYGWFRAGRGNRGPALVWMALGMGLGIGLSSVFLVPAMLTQDAVSMAGMTQGFNYYGNWFLFSEFGVWGTFTIKLTWMTLLVLLIAASAFVFARMNRPDTSQYRIATFWMSVVAVCVFMMTPLSKFVWEIAPVLRQIQFPYRISSVVTLAIAAIVASSLAAAARPYRMKSYLAAAFGVLLVIASMGATAWAARKSFSATNPAGAALVHNDVNLASREDVSEYRPRWGRERLATILESMGNAPARSDVDARIDAREWSPRKIALHVDSGAPGSIVVHQFYYPGWAAYLVDDESRALPVRPTEGTGLLAFDLPAGSHDVQLRLEPRWPESAGRLVSAASLVFVALIGWFVREKRVASSAVARDVGIPTARQMYLSTPQPEVQVQEELERNFFASIRLKNGTYKFTYSRRMDNLNALALPHLPAARPLRVMDVAVSSGVSTAEWADSLEAAGIAHTMLAGDLTAQAFLISATRNLHVLVDRSGYPLQYDVFGAPVPNPPGKRNLLKFAPLLWFLDAAVRLGFDADAALASPPDGSVRFGIRCRPVMFTSPRVHRRAGLRVIDDDIMEPGPHARQFHVLRAANILNRDYFSDDVLTKMIANLRSRLVAGGVFIVCCTTDDTVNHATVFRLDDGQRFSAVARLNGGVNIEDLVLAAR